MVLLTFLLIVIASISFIIYMIILTKHFFNYPNYKQTSSCQQIISRTYSTNFSQVKLFFNNILMNTLECDVLLIFAKL